MTPIEITAAIRDLCENGIPSAVPPVPSLPSLLAAYPLDNFDQYINYSPDNDKQKILSVYIDYDTDTTDQHIFGVIVHCQLHGDDQVQEYHSVIMPFLREFLTSDIVGFTERESIKGDIWPMDRNATSFASYAVGFSDMLDDCS